jgi:hypothetical protein
VAGGNELGELDDFFASPEDSSAMITFTPQHKNGSHQTFSNIFAMPHCLVPSHIIEIFNLPPPSDDNMAQHGETIGEMSLDVSNKKDPIKEYFILVTQAVKLCSPYMDAI